MKRYPKKKNACDKLKYKTQEEAEAGLGQVVALNMSKGQSHKDKGLHTYLCPDCHNWHVGHTHFYNRKVK